MEVFVCFAIGILTLFSFGGMLALSPIGTILYIVICALVLFSTSINETILKACVSTTIVTPIFALAIFFVCDGEIETSIATNAIMIAVMLATTAVSLLIQGPRSHKDKDNDDDRKDEPRDETMTDKKDALCIPVGRSRQEER